MVMLMTICIIATTFFTIATMEAALPIWFKKLMIRFTLLELFVDFGISWVMVLFTGTGTYAGIANLLAGAFAMLWVRWRWQQLHRIVRREVANKTFWRGIWRDIFPRRLHQPI